MYTGASHDPCPLCSSLSHVDDVKTAVCFLSVTALWERELLLSHLWGHVVATVLPHRRVQEFLTADRETCPGNKQPPFPWNCAPAGPTWERAYSGNECRTVSVDQQYTTLIPTHLPGVVCVRAAASVLWSELESPLEGSNPEGKRRTAVNWQKPIGWECSPSPLDTRSKFGRQGASLGKPGKRVRTVTITAASGQIVDGEKQSDVPSQTNGRTAKIEFVWAIRHQGTLDQVIFQIRGSDDKRTRQRSGSFPRRDLWLSGKETCSVYYKDSLKTLQGNLTG
ncbi:hypothetical protein Bbelb_181590 [Branchiostoma belcheri]|nr:hypothetical protein Bbelb_181590 [Branchiostoma belcheri]